jgi:hypothetical protein
MSNKLVVVCLLLLAVVAGVPACAAERLAKNTFRDAAPDKVAQVENIIHQQLGLLKTASIAYDRPILAQDYAVPIRNPFTQLPASLQQGMAQEGIDLKAMASYQALYVAGHLTGANALKIINTDPRTVLVIGSGTITHQPIYSRGPIVLVGDPHLMSDIYSEDLLWYGVRASNAGVDPNVGFPVITSVDDPQHSLGVNPYTADEESRALSALGSNKTHRDASDSAPVVAARDSPGTPRTTIRVPEMDEINNTAANQNRCQGYAAYAVEQNALNKRYGCGFTGLRWNDDQAGQAAWCMKVLENETDAESAARAQQLDACAIQKSALDNPANQPAIPPACHDPTRQFQPVKSIYHAYRYRKELQQPVEGGLITRDYNRDGAKDYIFLEVQGDDAQVTACLSNKGAYVRQPSEIRFSVAGDDLEGMQYDLSAEGDGLKLEIGYLMHDIGDSYRTLRYRYDTAQQAFVITENKAEVTPQYYDNQPAPMGEPPAPQMTQGR